MALDCIGRGECGSPFLSNRTFAGDGPCLVGEEMSSGSKARRVCFLRLEAAVLRLLVGIVAVLGRIEWEEMEVFLFKRYDTR